MINKIALFSIVIGSALLTTLYFIPFHNGFSLNGNDWGSFGAYFGGILGGILTPVTLYFVYQTFDMTKKQADLEIVSKLYSDLIQEINNLQYRRKNDKADKEGILYVGIDAIYQFDGMHHDSPNSILNHINSIINSFDYLLQMVNQVKYKYAAQKDIMLRKTYLLYYSKISWPVGHSIYNNRVALGLTDNPDYTFIISNYKRLTNETQAYLEKHGQVGTPRTDWMKDVLKQPVKEGN